ncbi:hypothetical protein NMY22_g13213 [Coprinellus aureogranulatus]|nr:hypothetical protein NMY22_g13213 [Coprinellus aureogranulatus]
MNPNAIPSSPPPQYTRATLPTPNASSNLCVVCQARPRYNRNRRSYDTCGLTCASRLQQGGLSRMSSNLGLQRSPSTTTFGSVRIGQASSSGAVQASSHPSASAVQPGKPACVVRILVLWKRGILDPDQELLCSAKRSSAAMAGIPTSATTATSARASAVKNSAALLASRWPEKLASSANVVLGMASIISAGTRGPYNVRYGLAFMIVKHPGRDAHYLHAVEDKFRSSWKAGGTVPTIKRVFKVIESADLRRPYDAYRNMVGNEQFRYHGTLKTCRLGESGNTNLCSSSSCSACNILRTSFKVGFGNASGAFGQGVYTSSASNKSYSYTGGGTGVLLVTKAALGRVYQVNQFAAVRGCPSGYNSVVFNRNGGNLNETVVYRDEAVRPVFMITF